MERQLVQHGKSTVMVSLPRKWVQKKGLHKGDSIHITELADKIVISPAQRKEELLEAVVTIPTADYELVRALLGTLYRKGYQKITVTYPDPKTIYYIQLITKAIHGFEIVEQTETKCVLRNYTKELELDRQEILSKVTNIIRMEFILVREYLHQGIKGKDNEIKSIRDDCWKFRNMLYVHLHDTILFSAFNDYFLAHVLEHNASFLYWLYRSFDQSDVEKVSSDFLSLYDAVKDYFENSMVKMKKKDKDYIQYIMINRDKLLHECEQFALKKTNDRFLVMYIAMLVQNIHNPKSLIV